MHKYHNNAGRSTTTHTEEKKKEKSVCSVHRIVRTPFIKTLTLIFRLKVSRSLGESINQRRRVFGLLSMSYFCFALLHNSFLSYDLTIDIQRHWETNVHSSATHCPKLPCLPTFTRIHLSFQKSPQLISQHFKGISVAQWRYLIEAAGPSCSCLSNGILPAIVTNETTFYADILPELFSV